MFLKHVCNNWNSIFDSLQNDHEFTRFRSYLIVISNKFLSLFYASIKLRNSSLQQIQLICSQCSQTKVLLNTIWSQDNRSGKILCLGHVRLDVSTLDDTLLAFIPLIKLSVNLAAA